MISFPLPAKSFISLLLLLILSEANPDNDLTNPERDDLVEIRDSLTSILNLHSNWTGPPCYKNQSRWIGIACSDSHVVSLYLKGIQLTGSLRASSLQNLTYLTSLSLSDNALRGDLPTLKGLLRLRIISFSRNKFSGSIPSEYVTLPKLTLLELHDNLLNGGIPSFRQKGLSVFNVSFNFLHGRIPESPVLQSFPSSSYEHNLGLCGKPVDRFCPGSSPSVFARISPPPPHPPSPSRPSGNNNLEFWSLILVAVCAVMAPSIVILGFLCYYKLYHKEASRRADNSEDVLSDFTLTTKAQDRVGGEGLNRFRGLEFFDKDTPVFSLDDLLRSSAELLGKGKVGTTYRVTLESGTVVVVKRLKEMGGVSRREFVQQMQLIGMMKHENTVEIIAYYYSKDEKLIIYENVPDGSLFQLLHENRGEGRQPLNWPARLSIVKGIARGLSFLQHSLPPNSHKLPHSNLKSSNVLIAPNHHPKLTDFGFLPLLPSPQQARRLAIRNTPEFKQGKKLDYKADIYCFGIMLVEILTGQNPEEHEGGLGEWVRSAVSREWSTDVLDLEIVAEKEGHGEMFKLMEVALDCTATEASKRPKMSELIERIEGIKEGSNGEGSLLT